MGGGDLNLKKSWHPNTLKNQEKVWKAEQHKKDEDRKIEEMRREIHDERIKEELIDVAHKSGVVKEKSDKLNWMYKTPAEQTSREEYLLGRKIDKTLEMMDENETAAKEGKEPPSSKPVYVIEHEVAPESFLRRTEDFQVDLKRKILEDPLYEIRHKEEDAKAAVRSNPIKMKNIQKLLENIEKKSKKKKKKFDKKKKHKKEKKKKKKKRQVSSSSSSSESSDDEPIKDSKRRISESAHNYEQRRRPSPDRQLSNSDRRTDHRRDHNSSPSQTKRNRRSSDSEERRHTIKKPRYSRERNRRSRSKDVHMLVDHRRREVYSNNRKYSKTNKRRDQSLSDNEGKRRRDRISPTTIDKKYYKYESSDSSLIDDVKFSKNDRERSPLKNVPRLSSRIERTENWREESLENCYRERSERDRSDRYSHSENTKEKIDPKIHKSPLRDERKSLRVKRRSVSSEEREDNRKSRMQKTEDEMARLRKVMMEAAKKRDSERKQNIERYEEQEKKQLDDEKNTKGKLRTMSCGTWDGSVETSIRSRAAKSQRGEGHMEHTFLRK